MDAYRSLEHRSAIEVLFAYPHDWGALSGIDFKDTATLECPDIANLANDLGLDLDQLLNESLAYVNRFGEYVVPWPVTYKIARRIADRYSDTVLKQIRNKEREMEHCAVHGRTVNYIADMDLYISREKCRTRLEEERPVYDLVRMWCGSPAVERFDEVEALHAEVKRWLVWSTRRPVPWSGTVVVRSSHVIVLTCCQAVIRPCP